MGVVMADRLTSGDRRRVQKRVAARGWTKAKRVRFLAVLADSCNVKRAVEAVGMTPSGAYQLRKRDAAFADLWAEALAIGYERLETALLEHALIGVNAIDMGEVIDAAYAEDRPDQEGAEGTGGAILPGSGFSVLALTPATIQLALALLNRHDRPVDGRRLRSGRKPATPEETDAALKKQLDALARKLIGSPPEGNA